MDVTNDVLTLKVNHITQVNDNFWECHYTNLSNNDEKSEINLSSKVNLSVLHRSNIICSILSNPNLDCNDTSVALELSLATNRTNSIMDYFQKIVEQPLTLNKNNITLHYHRLFDVKADLNRIGLDISNMMNPFHIIQYMLESNTDPVVLLYELKCDIPLKKNIPISDRYQGFCVRKETADYYLNIEYF
ncbi:hypothetical protein C9J21_19905 [Photobacterium phosphoreum]|uniref:hypothetical protein n=1 Tax=Photobacterium phosphoreum TaxID=659 RepID=UPI000D16FEE8|nr:hypothetical protein [Photobacterium phosphoreum]PSW29153.1 hypothetical protein C9J21_19905 [Photobacterium phosphoreum]